MFGIKGSRWFVLCLFMIVCAWPTGTLAAGPVPPPPTCITVLPAITTECASNSQPQTSHVASAESKHSSQARVFSVAATPSLARSLVGEVNRVRRAHHLRPLATSARLSRAATGHATALATAGMFTHSWPTTGRLFSSWIRHVLSGSGLSHMEGGREPALVVAGIHVRRRRAAMARQPHASPRLAHELLARAGDRSRLRGLSARRVRWTGRPDRGGRVWSPAL